MRTPTCRETPAIAARATAQAGYTYVGLIVFLAVLALASAATMQVTALMARRSAEERLLLIGHEFRTAIRAYYMASPRGSPSYPASLSDLQKDPRYAEPRRYMRRIYEDPLTGRADWGTLTGPLGGIAGVYSVAPGVPIKQRHFERLDAFDDSPTYRDWQFVFVPGGGGRPAGVPITARFSSDPWNNPTGEP